MPDRLLMIKDFYWCNKPPTTQHQKAQGETREEMYTRRVLEMLPRRALVPTMMHKAPLAPEPPASAPAPEPEPEPEPEPSLVVNGLELFVDGDKLISHKAHELLLR
nr:uncharacterized protein LOC113711065 isoform X2 [Coffea arabica]